MKKYLTTSISIATTIIFLFSLGSCGRKDKGTSTGTFYFHIHTNIDTSEVEDVSELYRDASGRHFSLSTAQLYISGVTLHNVNGSSYTIRSGRCKRII